MESTDFLCTRARNYFHGPDHSNRSFLYSIVLQLKLTKTLNDLCCYVTTVNKFEKNCITIFPTYKIFEALTFEQRIKTGNSRLQINEK